MSGIYFEMSWARNGVLIYFFELEETSFGHTTKDCRPVVLAETLAFFWRESGLMALCGLIKTQMCLYSRDITFWDCLKDFIQTVSSLWV